MQSLANPAVMKEINTDIVRNVLRSKRAATKPRVAELSGLSIVTAGAILNQLVRNGEVMEKGMVPSSGGRPAQCYIYNENFRHAAIIYTAVTSGKDTVTRKIINLYGEVLFAETIPAGKIALKRFESIMDSLMAQDPLICAAGFGLPGFERNGVIYGNDYPELTGTRFGEHYAARYGIPISIENDVNLAVIGYTAARSHAVRDEDSGAVSSQPPPPSSAVYMYFPRKYPPGSGIVLNGALYKGAGQFAGEVAFLPGHPDWITFDYESVRKTCTAISDIIVTYVCTLNPELVVLCGDFLTGAHVCAISERCRTFVDEAFVPRIEISDDFRSDFERGLIVKTLETILPQGWDWRDGEFDVPAVMDADEELKF